jgi:phage-related minor tail protein
MAEQSVSGMTVKISIDAEDAIKDLKRIARAVKEATQALKELEQCRDGAIVNVHVNAHQKADPQEIVDSIMRSIKPIGLA